MMKRGLKSTPRHPIEITLANFVHLANSCDSMFSSPFFYACIPQFIIKWNNFRAYRRKILNRFERTDEKYRPSRRDVEKGTRISSPRGWYIYIFLVVSSRRVSLIWQWKESTVEKGGNMNNYARFGSIFFFFYIDSSRSLHLFRFKIDENPIWLWFMIFVFFLFFSLFFAHNSVYNNPSLRLISPQTIHKKYESTNRSNHQSPSTKRPTRRESKNRKNQRQPEGRKIE